MTKALTTTKEFKQDVLEYKQMEQKIAENFLNGVIQLGEVLYRAREKWKAERKWLEYLEAIGRNQGGVNQMIRLYEYSQDNMKKLLKAGVDNWAKANMLLALPEELKDKLAEQVDGESISSKEYKEKVDLVKEEDMPEVEIVNDIDLMGIEVTPKMINMLENASMADLNFAAREIRKEMNKQGYNFSVQCVPVMEAYLSLNKALETISGEARGQLSHSEKRYWNKMLRNAVAKLNKELS